MDESKRVKILLGILGLAVLGYFGIPLFKSTFLEPITDREKDLEVATNVDDAAFQKVLLLKKAESDLFDWAGRSLPADPENALDVYQSWIYDLAVHSGMDSVEVTPEKRRGERKVGVFESVLVNLECAASQEAVQTFLYRFEKVNLMHRVSRLVLEADSPDGNPLFTVVMSLEGVCMVDGPQRKFLFPQTGLSEPVEEDATTIQVTSTEGFPNLKPDPDAKPGAIKPPSDFLISLNGEVMKVVDTDDRTFTVERGADSTSAAEHDKQTIVRLFPVHPARKESRLDDYKSLLEKSPFTKPRPPVKYSPRIIDISDKSHMRGEDFRQTVRAMNFDPKNGKPTYKLADDSPNGMTINPESGRIEWDITDEVESKEYAVTVFANWETSGDELSKSFKVTLKDPNDKPVITVAEKAKVYLGSELKITATATDDGDKDALKFSGEGLPTGATIDEKTGEFKWAAPEDFVPGEYTFDFEVTDDKGEKASQKVTIEAVEDFAKYTRLTGITGPVGQQEIWFFNQKSDESMVLTVGKEFQVADVSGKIVKADFKSIEFVSEDRRYRLPAGRFLRAMEEIKDSAKTPASEESATPAAPAPATTDKVSMKK